MSHKAYKFRIYPNKQQANSINNTFGCVRFLWNKHVSAFYSYATVGPNPVITSKLLKDNPEYTWLNDVSAAALQQKDRDFIEFKRYQILFFQYAKNYMVASHLHRLVNCWRVPIKT